MFTSLLFFAALSFAQDESVFSGPQPGEKLTPFKIVGTTGKDTDKEINVLEEAGDNPAVVE